MTGCGEFELIEYISKRFCDLLSDGVDGIGDDCAVIPVSETESLVFTTDMLCEDVHFLRRAASPHEIGYKSLAVNLSDVAAMGARPVASMLSVSLPADCSEEWIRDFMDGYECLSRQYGVALIGGDTVGSSGKIIINVVAIGKASSVNIKRRSDARTGDIIAVNGFLGNSAAGLDDVLSGRFDTPSALLHHHPVPQIEEGMWLGGRKEVHAMMDISDGIASDLPHIMKQSNLGAEVYLDKVPTTQTLEKAVAGGEDYKLMLTVEADLFSILSAEYRMRFGSELYMVGRMTPQCGYLRWMLDGQEIIPDFVPFRHF